MKFNSLPQQIQKEILEDAARTGYTDRFYAWWSPVRGRYEYVFGESVHIEAELVEDIPADKVPQIGSFEF